MMRQDDRAFKRYTTSNYKESLILQLSLLRKEIHLKSCERELLLGGARLEQLQQEHEDNELKLAELANQLNEMEEKVSYVKMCNQVAEQLAQYEPRDNQIVSINALQAEISSSLENLEELKATWGEKRDGFKLIMQALKINNSSAEQLH